MDQVSFANVSVGAPVLSRSRAAAAADGARPTTWPPLSIDAGVKARTAVVLPAPAGAMASWRRAPDMLIDLTNAACPGSKVTPLAACSNSASSTISAGAVRPSMWPATATTRCSAARMRAEVNSSEPATV